MFQVDFDKSYGTDQDKIRFEIFKKNVALIEEHNARFARGEETSVNGINQFTDMTQDEFMSFTGQNNNMDLPEDY